MITGIVKGKILLKVQKINDLPDYGGNVELLGLNILSCNAKEPNFYVYDDLNDYLSWNFDLVPSLKIDEKITLKCKYKIIYSCDYFGEYDADFEFDKIKVLRRVKAKYLYIEKSRRNS